jgi:hypothetical protein
MDFLPKNRGFGVRDLNLNCAPNLLKEVKNKSGFKSPLGGRASARSIMLFKT